MWLMTDIGFLNWAILQQIAAKQTFLCASIFYPTQFKLAKVNRRKIVGPNVVSFNTFRPNKHSFFIAQTSILLSPGPVHTA